MDMAAETGTRMTERERPAAGRRSFRSKIDGIRPTYGFEDVSLAPGTETVEPADVRLDQSFCGLPLEIPVLAAAMDAVVDAHLAGELARLGGLAVLNLEGVQTRFEDPDAIVAGIASAPDDQVHDLLAQAYATPIQDRSSHGASTSCMRRVAAAVAATPGAARKFGPFCAEHGADLFLVQSQVSSARHLATGYDPLSLAEFTRFMPIPVAVGNTTNPEAAYLLMEQGAAAVFVGVGPGAACTTREVLGIGVPQVTAIADVAGARDAYLADTGRYVPVVADGGMKRGGDLAKAIAAGADAVMLGSPLARATEAPGGDQLGHGRAFAGAAARDADQGRDRRSAGADPRRPVLGHRRDAEPHRRAATVDGRAGCPDHRRDARRRDRLRAVRGDRREVLAARSLNLSLRLPLPRRPALVPGMHPVHAATNERLAKAGQRPSFASSSIGCTRRPPMAAERPIEARCRPVVRRKRHPVHALVR